jgi:hypothetical protein
VALTEADAELLELSGWMEDARALWKSEAERDRGFAETADRLGVAYDPARPRRLLSDAVPAARRGQWARLINSGVGALHRGQAETAMTQFRSAVLLARDLGVSDWRLPKSLDCLAAACHRLDRHDEAHRLAGEAVKLAARTFGDHHPAVADLLDHCAAVLKALGRSEEADRVSGRAGRIREQGT